MHAERVNALVHSYGSARAYSCPRRHQLEPALTMATFTYCNLNNVAVQHTTGVPILVYVECDIPGKEQQSGLARNTKDNPGWIITLSYVYRI